MAVYLVDLVLKAKMPIDMQSRAAKKLVLVCLAKVCQNENGLECYPSRATMALAAERTERTIDAFLDDLAKRGFISETDKPRRHRPRTWRIHVDRLLDLQPVAPLEHQQDSQPVAPLPVGHRTDPEVLDRQFQPVDLQLRNLDSQFQRLESQPVATERSERSEQREQIPGAIAPLSVSLQKERTEKKDPTTKDFAVTKRLAFEVVERLGMTADYADHAEELKTRLATLGIPYDVRSVHVAMLTARMGRQRTA